MLISGRDARSLLESAGLSSRHARIALLSGLVGEPLRTNHVHLYDQDRVRELAGRPSISWRQVNDACPTGIFVSRRAIDVTRPGAEQIGQVCGGWGDVDPWCWFAMGLHLADHGSLPFVATVSGFVVLAADIEGLRDGSELVLAPAGSWFGALERRRFWTGPGRPWELQLSPRRTPQGACR
jgi:hypothetical protein